MSRNSQRRGQRRSRRVRVFSDLNHELRPETLAKIITAAGLEQARLEAESKAQHEEATKPGAVEADHA